jgi:hypothetical protein
MPLGASWFIRARDEWPRRWYLLMPWLEVWFRLADGDGSMPGVTAR